MERKQEKRRELEAISPVETHDKCARRGCNNLKWEGEAFCLTCIALKHDGPGTSCDNFPALRVPT